MDDARRRRRARRLLWVWAVVSLIAVAYTGLLFASSVSVDERVASDLARGSDRPARPGDRLFVLPLQAPREEVVPFAGAGEDERTFGDPGDVVQHFPAGGARPRSVLPFQNQGASFARVLLYVERNGTNETGWSVPALNLTNATVIRLEDVPQTDAQGNFTRGNLTVDLTGYAGTRGFVVKRDAAAAPEAGLVPPEAVVGKALRSVSGAQMYASLAFSVLGALLPLVLIVLTHRGRGVRGVEGVSLCRECRSPLEPGLDFCTRCGAAVPRGP